MTRCQAKIFIALIVISTLFLSGCLGGKKVPNLNLIFSQARLRKGKRPVIIIPGILGSELINSKTKERTWINLSGAKGDGLSLPISPDLSKNRDDLVPKGIIEKAKISAFLPEVYVYQALIDSMERYGGYTAGDWENPETANGGMDKYYVFAYDWRRDNVENAQLLIRKIHELKSKLDNPALRFNVIAHSMGGLIARYAAMYGDEDLPENGETPVPDWSGAQDFNKIFMFGTPNEGSMSTLEILIKGYQIGGFSIRNLNSEAVVTSPAVFQLLPHQGTARFYDEDLRPLEIDLYNPETWKKYGWSAYTSKTFLNKFAGQSGALDSSGRKGLYTDVSLADLDAYFANVLKRAKSFQAALDANTAIPPSVSFFAFGSDCDKTLDGAIVVKSGRLSSWQTIFTPRNFKTFSGKSISKASMVEKLYAPGDFRVTRRSLLAETITEQNSRNSNFLRNLPVSATFLCETHNELPNSKIMQDNFLTALISEIVQ